MQIKLKYTQGHTQNILVSFFFNSIQPIFNSKSAIKVQQVDFEKY